MADRKHMYRLPTSMRLKNLSDIDSNLTRATRIKSESLNENIPKLIIEETEID